MVLNINFMMVVLSLKNLFRVVLSVFLFSYMSFVYSQNMYVGLSLVDVSYSRDEVKRAILPPDDPLDFTTDICAKSEDLNVCGERPSLFFDADSKLKSFSVKYGYQINQHFALELRGAIGVSEPDLEEYSEDIETQLGVIPGTMNQPLLKVRTTPKDARLIMNSSFGIYARLGGTQEHPISLKAGVINVAPYLLVGHERNKFSTTIEGGDAGIHTDDLTYGLGFNIYLFEDMPGIINIEWREQTKDISSNSTQLDLQQLSVGIDFLF